MSNAVDRALAALATRPDDEEGRAARRQGLECLRRFVPSPLGGAVLAAIIERGDAHGALVRVLRERAGTEGLGVAAAAATSAGAADEDAYAACWLLNQCAFSGAASSMRETRQMCSRKEATGRRVRWALFCHERVCGLCPRDAAALTCVCWLVSSGRPRDRVCHITGPNMSGLLCLSHTRSRTLSLLQEGAGVLERHRCWLSFSLYCCRCLSTIIVSFPFLTRLPSPASCAIARACSVDGRRILCIQRRRVC